MQVPSRQNQPSRPSSVVHWKAQPISSEPSSQSASPSHAYVSWMHWPLEHSTPRLFQLGGRA